MVMEHGICFGIILMFVLMFCLIINKVPPIDAELPSWYGHDPTFLGYPRTEKQTIKNSNVIKYEFSIFSFTLIAFLSK